MDRVVHNREKSRFEISVPGGTALLEYKLRNRTLALVHTEVPDGDEGRGVGSALAGAALDYARSSNLQVVPSCEFVITYLRRHPEYLDLVKPAYRDRVLTASD